MILTRIAYRNVKKNWRHSLSALLSLSTAFVVLVLFDGYMYDIKKMNIEFFQYRNEMGHFFIQDPRVFSKAGIAEPWKFYINEKDQQTLDVFFQQNSNFIKAKVRFLDFQGLITNGQQSTIVLGRGSDVDESRKIRNTRWEWNAIYGVPLYLSKEPHNILLGQGLAKRLGCKWQKDAHLKISLGYYQNINRPFDCPRVDLQISTLTYEAQLNALDVNTVGITDGGIKEIDDTFAVMSLESAQDLLNTKLISFLSVELQDPNNYDLIAQRFKETVQISAPQLQISKWQNHPYGAVYRKTIDFLAIFKNFVTVVILVISTLSVINTLIKMIKERNKEIGTLRSLGFKSREVLNIFICETFFLTTLGSSIGLVVSASLAWILNSFKIMYKAGMLSEPVLFQISLTWSGYLTAFLVLTSVGLLSCLITTKKTLSLKVIENLNHI